jgi:DNA-binding GntR family transcriptional regulator
MVLPSIAKGPAMAKTPSTTTTALSGHRRGSGVGHVYETLRNEIIELKLAPGSPVDEVMLAERFALSRTPIREALVRLVSDGLVTTLPNRATIVANIDFLALPQFFDALTLMYRVTTRLAAVQHEPADLEAITTYQNDFADAVAARDALAMIATNRQFHHAIALAGRNKYYARLFAQLLDEGRRYYSSFNDALPARYVSEHEALIAAIGARDVELCDRLAAEHAEQIVRQIKSYITAETSLNTNIAL